MNRLTKLTMLSAVVALLSCATLTAEPKKETPPQTTPPTAAAEAAKEAKAKPAPFHGKVESVDVTAKTITLEGKEKKRVLQVTDTTKFTKGNPPVAATLADVTAGETISGRWLKNGEKQELVSVFIGKREGSPDDKKPKKDAPAPGADAHEGQNH